MRDVSPSIDPRLWLRRVLSSRDAARGAVIVRQLRDIDRITGRDAFLAEVERRGWQALVNGAHLIVLCNAEAVRRIRAGGPPARAGG